MPKGKGNKQPAQKSKGKGKKSASRKAARAFELNLDSLDAGPFGLKGLSMASRNARNAASTVGLAPHSMNIQTEMPEIKTIHGEDGRRIDILEGTDLVTTITGDVGDVPGSILKKILINPSAFPNTRMAQLAPLYQRYRFLEIDFFYEPIAPATQRGQLLGFCDFDVDVDLPDADAQNLQRGAAHEGQAICQVWEPQIFSMSQSRTFTDLFVSPNGEDPRLSYQGIFYLLSASVQDASALGNLYMRYKLEFTIPQLQTGLGVVSGATAQVNAADLSNLFGSTITPDVLSTLTLERVDGDNLKVSGVSPGGTVILSYYGNFNGTGFAANSGLSFTPTGAGTVAGGGFMTFTSSTNYATTGSWQCVVNPDTTELTINLTAGTTPTSTANGSIFVTVTSYPLDAGSALVAMRKRKAETVQMLAEWKAFKENLSRLERAERSANPAARVEEASPILRGNPDAVVYRSDGYLPSISSSRPRTGGA